MIPVSTQPAIPVNAYTEPAAFKQYMKDLPGKYWSVADYHELYLSGALTPLAVAESLLPLIRRDIVPRSDHSVAFVNSNVDLVLQAATASTQRYKEGKSLGILDGIPVGVKDELDVAGYRTFSGRKGNEKIFDLKTKTVWPVQKWQEAGIIVMGKLNMHEIGAGESDLSSFIIRRLTLDRYDE